MGIKVLAWGKALLSVPGKIAEAYAEAGRTVIYLPNILETLAECLRREGSLPELPMLQLLRPREWKKGSWMERLEALSLLVV